MPQSLEISQSVDVTTLSLRLNRTLQPQGIKAAIACQQSAYQCSRLQITLESLDPLERDRLPQQVLQILRELRLPIKTVELAAYRTGDPQPVWQQRLRLSDGQVLIAPARPLPLDQPIPSDQPILPDERQSSTQRPAPSAHRPDQARLDQYQPDQHWQDQSESAIVAAAQRGDTTAIQAYVQAIMAPYAIASVQTQLAAGVLTLTITSTQYLGGPGFASELVTALLPLHSDRVQVLAIYKRKFDGALPFLIQQVELSTALGTDQSDAAGDPWHDHWQRQACPIGVKLIAGLYLAVGGLNMALALIMAIVLYGFAASVQKLPNVSIMFPYLGSSLLLAIAVAAGAGLVAIALWERQRWGLWLSYLLSGVMLFRSGQMLIDTWGTSTLMIPIEMALVVLLIVMLVYLTRPNVTRYFR